MRRESFIFLVDFFAESFTFAAGLLIEAVDIVYSSIFELEA